MASEFPLPPWEGVLITERVEYGDAGRIKAMAPLQEADDFRGRFAELVTLGWPWLNLHALGVLDQHLIVAVEPPAAQPSGAEFTSVNISGFNNFAEAHGYRLEELLDR